MKVRLLLALALTACGVSNEKSNDLKLINGQVVDKDKEFPASVYAAMGNARCTATVVGERTLLIASHCVANGGRAVFAVKNIGYSATCSRHPNYPGNTTADWALCLVTTKVEGIPYEKVNTSMDVLMQENDRLLLTGYGCIRPNGGGGNDGKYRVGEARIKRLPSTDSTNNDIVTVGGGALCYGDSGGPAFKVFANGKRVLVSVNSRGDIKTTSYLVATHTDMAQSFFKAWALRNSQKICGVHADAQGCR